MGVSHSFHILRPLLSKSKSLTYKLLYKLHFSMNPFHCDWIPPLLPPALLLPIRETFIRAKNSFANETLQKCSPPPLTAPQRDRMPPHCSRSMGAAGMVGRPVGRDPGPRAHPRGRVPLRSALKGIISSLGVLPRRQTTDNHKVAMTINPSALTPTNYANTHHNFSRQISHF